MLRKFCDELRHPLNSRIDRVNAYFMINCKMQAILIDGQEIKPLQ